MTMRQVVGLLRVIQRADLVRVWDAGLSYRIGAQKDFPSLPDFLNLTSGKDAEPIKAFDEKTDRLLEEQALKALAERQKEHGTK